MMRNPGWVAAALVVTALAVTARPLIRNRAGLVAQSGTRTFKANRAGFSG